MKCTNKPPERASTCGPAQFTVVSIDGKPRVTQVARRYNLPDNREMACGECAEQWIIQNTVMLLPLEFHGPLVPVQSVKPDRIERVRHNNQPMP